MTHPEQIALNSFVTLGVIQIAHAISLVLFGIATVQVYYYYHNFPRDRIALKIAIAAIWLNILALVALDGYSVIAFSITPPGSFTRPSGYNAAIIPSRLMEFLIQGVYSYRVYRFSGRIIIPIICSLLSVFAVFCSILSTVQSQATRSLPVPIADFDNSWAMASIYITNALVSSLIATAMVYYLVKRREDGYRIKTRRQIDRLIVWTFQSGLVPSILSIAGLVLFITSPNTQAYTLLLIVTPALSANGLYAMLNDRRQLRDLDENLSADINFDLERNHADGDLNSSQNTDDRQPEMISKGIQYPIHQTFSTPIDIHTHEHEPS